MPAKKAAPKPLSLNEEQQLVVGARQGYFSVLAGPGSGKSFCLVSRYATLIQEGVSPNDILSLSFTNAAAKNLRERVEDAAGKLSINRTAGALTFHGLALRFAQEERDEFPFDLAEFPLATEPVANKLSGESARRYEIDPRTLRSYVGVKKRQRVRAAACVLTAENSLNAPELKLALAYKEYEKKLHAAGVLDFDSLIFEMVELLSKKPEVRKRWVYPWIMVDEAQDLSVIEWDLVKLVAGKSVLAVGDVSQGIYSFRGSAPEMFAGMNEIFPGTQTLYLSRNYRSSPEIVDFIRPIGASRELAEKFHTVNPSGPKPLVKEFANSADEAVWVVAKIKEGLK